MSARLLKLDRDATNVVSVCSDWRGHGSRDVVIVRALTGGKKSLLLVTRDGEEACDVFLDRAAAVRIAALLMEPHSQPDRNREAPR